MMTLTEFVQVWAIQKGWGPLPHHHRLICDWLDKTKDSHKHRLLQAYRDSGKSFLTQLYVAWRLLLDPNYTCIVFSAGDRLARRNSAFIRKVIEEHMFTKHLVNDDDLWQRGAFTVRREMSDLDPSVTCLSLGSKVTGNHSYEILCDDIETSDNVQTEDGREKIRDAIYEVNNMVGRILAVGTPHHEDTIYNYFETEQEYETVKFPALNPDGTAFASDFTPKGERHDLAWIEKKRGSMPLGKFQSQYLLIPAKAYQSQFRGDGLIQFSGEVKIGEPDMLDTDPVRRRQPTFWIIKDGADPIQIKDLRAYYDPASGLRNRDNAVLAVVAKDEQGRKYILDAAVLPPMLTEGEDRFAPQFHMILEVCKRTLCNTILVEKNFSSTLGSELRKYAKSVNARVRIKETNRTSKQNKIEFIAEHVGTNLTAGLLHIHEDCFRQFKSELEDFPKGRHDDRLDAVAGAIAELSPTRVDQSGTKLLNEKGFHRNPTVHLVNKYEPRSVV